MRYQIIAAYVGGQYAHIVYETNDVNDMQDKLAELRANKPSTNHHYWVLTS